MLEHYRVVTSSKESELQSASINVMLINMGGEESLSLHEPLGIEVIAARLIKDVPDVRVVMYDTQQEMVRSGRVNTDKLATDIKEFAESSQSPFLLGIGIQIEGWSYTQSLLLKLEQNPPKTPITIVFGNAMPTLTKPEIIKQKFPYIKLVIGEGEEGFAKTAKNIASGKPVDDIIICSPANLNEYISPLRVLTQDIIEMGGTVKIETGRGCPYGGCTFCSRSIRGGKDYRTLPEAKVVDELNTLFSLFNIARFELTDEEAFGDSEAVTRLISAVKSADLPVVPFVASMRVDILNDLYRNGLLEQLQNIGLEKIFIGVEGGSDAYLKQLAKKQTMDEVYEAIDHLKERGLDYEMGFIMFSWRMTFEMLRDNIKFLSEGDHTDHVSALFNVLRIQPSTGEEILLRKMVAEGTLGDYNPDSHFSISHSRYNDVPFLDEKVARVSGEVLVFAKQDLRLFRALRSLVRANTLPNSMKDIASEQIRALRLIHLKMLRFKVGLEEDLTENSIVQERTMLVQNIINIFGNHQSNSTVDFLRREAQTFLIEEDQRIHALPNLPVSLFVFMDKHNRIMLSRSRGEERWSFPGGRIRNDENILTGGMREIWEELRATNIKIIRPLPTIVKHDVQDELTGNLPNVTFYHHLVELSPSEIQKLETGNETVDTLWISVEDILTDRIEVKDNVKEIAAGLRSP